MEKVLKEAKEKSEAAEAAMLEAREEAKKQEKKRSSLKRNFSRPKRRRLLRGRWHRKQETLRKVSKWMGVQKRKRRTGKTKRRAGSATRMPEPRKRANPAV